VGPAWPHTLSGGMAQRVAYAAATVGGARLLIVDEPSKGLDRASLDRLAVLLGEHVAAGGLLLTITHDLDLARRLGGEVLVMRDAVVLERGPADRVLTTPAHAYARLLLEAEPGRWQLPWMREQAPTGAPLVTATGIGKGYETRLFDGLDLPIGAGERWALTGPSGSGKTTLGNVLLGLVRPDAGSVQRVPALEGRAQKLYQDPTLSFPAKVSLGLALADVCRRHGVPEVRMHDLVARVGLDGGLLARRPSEVSGGELQRLAVVRAMVTNPLLLLADEATSRLDLLTQRVTMDCLMEQVDSTGCALLAVTHDPALAAAVADREVVLGRVGAAV
jgi:peptide/nickel transport system ATP-binding protein